MQHVRDIRLLQSGSNQSQDNGIACLTSPFWMTVKHTIWHCWWFFKFGHLVPLQQLHWEDTNLVSHEEAEDHFICLATFKPRVRKDGHLDNCLPFDTLLHDKLILLQMHVFNRSLQTSHELNIASKCLCHQKCQHLHNHWHFSNRLAKHVCEVSMFLPVNKKIVPKSCNGVHFVWLSCFIKCNKNVKKWHLSKLMPNLWMLTSQNHFSKWLDAQQIKLMFEVNEKDKNSSDFDCLTVSKDSLLFFLSSQTKYTKSINNQLIAPHTRGLSLLAS